MRLLLLLFIISILGSSSNAQSLQLLLRRNGKTIKRYTPGDPIYLIGQKNYPVAGIITFLKQDSIFINNQGFALKEFLSLRNIKKKKGWVVDGKTFGLITLGVALSTAGMYFSKYEDFGTALAYSATIGYGPLLISQLARNISFKKKKYLLGKKYDLHVLDLTPLTPE